MSSAFLEAQYAAHMQQQEQVHRLPDVMSKESRTALDKLLQLSALWFAQIEQHEMHGCNITASTLYLGFEISKYVLSRLAIEGETVGLQKNNLTTNVWNPLIACTFSLYVERYMTRIKIETGFDQDVPMPRHVFWTDPLWMLIKPLYFLLWSCLSLAVDLNDFEQEISFKKANIGWEIAALCGSITPELKKELADTKNLVLFLTGIYTVHVQEPVILHLHATQHWECFRHHSSISFILGMCIEAVFEEAEDEEAKDEEAEDDVSFLAFTDATEDSVWQTSLTEECMLMQETEESVVQSNTSFEPEVFEILGLKLALQNALVASGAAARLKDEDFKRSLKLHLLMMGFRFAFNMAIREKQTHDAVNRVLVHLKDMTKSV